MTISRKKTILFMAHLPPPVHGAALRNQSLLDSQLLNDSFTILSLPLKFAESMTDLEKFSFRKVWLMILYGFKMLRILLTRRIDLAYFTMSPAGGAFYRDILFISLLKIFRKKRLLHFRVKGIQKTAGSAIGRKLVRYAFRGSDIVCLSRHHMLDMAGFTDREPYIVPNGIKIENEFLPPEIESASSSDTPVKILFLSNLSVRKGVPELMEALKMLMEKNYRFSTSLVGGEWDLRYDDVRRLIEEAGLQNRVIVEGSKYGRDKFRFITNADIFVFPTYFELFPGVILEAMQFGKAIVSTFEGSIPEMIDNHVNGLLVEQRNAGQLAEGIAYLIDNPERRKEMAELARQKFFAEFTLESFEHKMLAVWNDVIDKQSL